MSCPFFSEVYYLKTCSGIRSEALVATFPWGGGPWGPAQAPAVLQLLPRQESGRTRAASPDDHSPGRWLAAPRAPAPSGQVAARCMGPWEIAQPPRAALGAGHLPGRL